MKINNEQRKKIAKAQNIVSLIGKKLKNESKSAKEGKAKVDLDNIAESLANRREEALSKEG